MCVVIIQIFKEDILIYQANDCSGFAFTGFVIGSNSNLYSVINGELIDHFYTGEFRSLIYLDKNFKFNGCRHDDIH